MPFFIACADRSAQTPAVNPPQAPVPEIVALATAAPSSPAPAPTPEPTPEWVGEPKLRYVFLFIGDGMGPHQALAAEEALAAAGQAPLCFPALPVRGEMTTDNVRGKLTDSAAAATAMATGSKTENGFLGRDRKGRDLVNLPEALAAKDYQIGILTTVSLNHATPGGFYAHEDSRRDYGEIALDLFRSGFAYFAGGGLSKVEDAEALCARYGYTLARGDAAADAVPFDQKLVCFGDALLGDNGLALAADGENGRDGLLARNVARGIRRLTGETGFFMMTEGGRIDLACHYHDGGDMVYEVLDFDAAVREAFAFYEQHPHETLIVVTADHETGDLSLSGGDRAALLNQQVSCDWFDDARVPGYVRDQVPFETALPEILDAFGLTEPTDEELAYLRTAYQHTIKDDLSGSKRTKLYGHYEAVTSAAENLVLARAGLSFGTDGHSQANVPVYAAGVGAETFSGVYENTEICNKILALMQRYPA